MAETARVTRRYRAWLQTLGVQVSGTGEFNIRDALLRLDEAESSGRLSPFATQVFRQILFRDYVPFKVEDLPWARAGNARDFTPSYPVSSEVDYDARVEAARTLHLQDPRDYQQQKLKREGHVQLPSGRERLRYQHEDPTGRGRVFEMNATSKERLASNQPFAARTQAEGTRRALLQRREASTKEAVEAQIQAAIAKLMPEGAFGFQVPSLDTMLAAGFPRREAVILAERAPNALFLRQDTVKQLPTPLRQVQRCLGVTFTLIGYDLTITPENVERRPQGLFYQYFRASKNKRLTLRAVRIRVEGRGLPPVRAKTWQDWHMSDLWKTEEDLFLLLYREVQARRKSGQALTWVFYFGAPGSSEQEWVSAEVPIGEHSRFWCEEGRVDYRTLRGASLSRLPSLLTSITRRRAGTWRSP